MAADGQPGNPRGWLVTVATRKLLDQVRSEQSRRQREERIAVAAPQSELLAAAPDADAPPGTDDSLILLFGCCHPAINAPSQIALTLRAIGGLSTAQIAAAFGVPEATMAQRISRAKQACTRRTSRCRQASVTARAVLHVLYLIFSEGYTRPMVMRSPCPRSPARLSASPAGYAACCRTSQRWPACSRSCCSPTRAGPHAPRRTV